MTAAVEPGAVRLAALGDLMLCEEWETVAQGGGAGAAFRPLRTVLEDADLVFANLETAVPTAAGVIPKEPRILSGIVALERNLAAIGVNVVSLANNHAFDGYVAGFDAVCGVLARHRIHHFGAGLSAPDARKPCIVDLRGMRFGWLGYAAADTVPSHVAGPHSFGVSVLSEPRALDDVKRLRGEVDHVVVSLHWGVEYCHLPSPDQIRFARALVDAGARLVLGHHAHVVQGVERHGDGLVAYGLGNVTAPDLRVDSTLAIKQTRRTRSAFVLVVEFTPDAVRLVEQVPFRSAARSITMRDAYAARLTARANRALARGVSPGRWRRRRLLEDVVLRAAWKLDPRVVRSLRPRHVGKLIRNVRLSLLGEGPA